MVDEAAASAVGWSRMTDSSADTREAVTLADIERVYLEHAHRYARAAASVTGDRAAAEDAVQDAFARAIVHRAKFRGSGNLAAERSIGRRDQATAWLWRLVINSSLNGRRKVSSQKRAVDSVARTLEANTREPEIDDRARHDVMRLPKRQRAAVFLRYYADLDYAQIAEVLSVTPGGVAKLLHDAHATLARTMQPPR